MDPLYIQKTILTQLVYEMKLDHYLESLWAGPGMPNHTHLKLLSKFVALRISNHMQKFNFIPRLVREILYFKNPAFWLV